jgi:hypothetical protein
VARTAAATSTYKRTRRGLVFGQAIGEISHLVIAAVLLSGNSQGRIEPEAV